MKKCGRCGELKDGALFSRRAASPDGLQNKCKACESLVQRERKAAKPEWYAEWRFENSEVLADRLRRWRTDNPDRYRETSAAWRASHPQNLRRHEHNRRARKVEAFIEDVDRVVVWDRDWGICALCMELADPSNWHLEHLTPLSRGGEHSYANTAVSHPSCNLRKSTRTLAEWDALVGYVRAA